MSSDRLDVPQKKTAVDRVLDFIKRLILSKKLKSGDRLPSENELTALLGVSRSSVREAMKILAAFGVVTIQTGDGTYVSRSAVRSAFDPIVLELALGDPEADKVLELREGLETAIARLVVANAGLEDLRDIRRAFGEMETAGIEGISDPDRLLRFDVDFHMALARATKNPLIERVYSFVMEFFTPYILKSISIENAAAKSLELHLAIVRAVEARDSQAAIRAAQDSLAVWRAIFLHREQT